MTHTVISYIPALHNGYINFFKKYPGELFIVGKEFVDEYPRMERDIRAVNPEEMVPALRALKLFSNVAVLTKALLSQLEKKEHILMPDDELMHYIAETYLKDKKITFVPVFLRWDRHTAGFDKKSVEAHKILTESEFDREMMGTAFAHAEKSSDWWRQIGAIAVKDGKIILSGFNRPLPTMDIHNVVGDPRSNFDYGERFELSLFLHAEANIIAQAAKKGISLEGASLYVTTFPCPVCAKSVAESGIKKVYFSKGYSLLDAEELFKQKGIELVWVKMPND